MKLVSNQLVCSVQNLVATWPEVVKLFSCSTQLSTKFILLINVKMPTIVGILTFISRIFVGILTFISRINTTSESSKARKISVFHHFSFFMIS